MPKNQRHFTPEEFDALMREVIESWTLEQLRDYALRYLKRAYYNKHYKLAEEIKAIREKRPQ